MRDEHLLLALDFQTIVEHLDVLLSWPSESVGLYLSIFQRFNVEVLLKFPTLDQVDLVTSLALLVNDLVFVKDLWFPVVVKLE